MEFPFWRPGGPLVEFLKAARSGADYWGNQLSTAMGAARLRLEFIDGLRGIAALVVAVGHTIGMVGPDHPDVPLWGSDLEHLLMWPWLFGEQMVWLFILLSGFALYWSEETRILFKGAGTSLGVYARRRLWRILPTYYVSLGLGLIVVGGLGWLLLPTSPSLRSYDPITLDGVASHLFLVHNFSGDWIHQINPPLWSIAVEMQLYLLFPLLFVLRKRLSIYGAAALVVASVTVAGAFLPSRAFALVEWFIVGAVLAHIARRYRLSPPLLLSASALLTLVGLLRVPALDGRVGQVLWLIAFSTLVLGLTYSKPGPWNPPTWKIAAWLGERSYSLYAVHFPVALLAWAIVGRAGLDRSAMIVAVVLLGVASSIAIAHLCYRFIEKPSKDRSQSAGKGVGANTLRPRHAATRL